LTAGSGSSRSPGLGFRIALAAVVPAALALAAVDLFAVRAAREAERVQVERRLDAAARVVEEDRRFFLAVPSASADITARLARIAGFEFLLASREGVIGSSLPESARTTVLAATFPEDGHLELQAGGTGFLARRVTLDHRFLVLLFPTDAVDSAGQRAALPVLLASVAGLAAVAAAGAWLGSRLARPVRDLATTASRVARGESPELRADEGSGPPEARSLAIALNRMLDSLRGAEEARVKRERLAVLGEFAAGVAHDIRNPLSSLRMSLQIVERDASPDAREDIAAALEEMARLERSVGELLVYAGAPRPKREPFDPAAALDDAVRLLRRQAEHLGVTVRVEKVPPLPAAWTGDGDGFRTCVVNLVLNAIQASPRAAVVRVALRSRAADGALLLEVADAGPGVPAHLRERVFEPFFTGRAGGTGLGLAVVRRLADASGGSVECEPGEQGTVFRLTIAACREERPRDGHLA
jgi:signal transduction histidine kinase